MLRAQAKPIVDACKGDSGWSGAAKLDEIGNPNAGNAEVMPGLSTAQKNRVGVWKKSLAGFSDENAKENNSAQVTAQANDTAEPDRKEDRDTKDR